MVFKEYFKRVSYIIIVFLSFSIFFLGCYGIQVQKINNSIKSDRYYAEDFINMVENDISTHSGILNYDEIKSGKIGNRDFYILIDGNLICDKECFIEILNDNDTNIGMLLGKESILKIDRFGNFIELSYNDIESDSNIINGYDILKSVDLSDYDYEDIYAYIGDLLLSFFICLLLTLGIILGYFLIREGYVKGYGKGGKL